MINKERSIINIRFKSDIKDYQPLETKWHNLYPYLKALADNNFLRLSNPKNDRALLCFYGNDRDTAWLKIITITPKGPHMVKGVTYSREDLWESPDVYITDVEIFSFVGSDKIELHVNNDFTSNGFKSALFLILVLISGAAIILTLFVTIFCFNKFFYNTKKKIFVVSPDFELFTARVIRKDWGKNELKKAVLEDGTEIEFLFGGILKAFYKGFLKKEEAIKFKEEKSQKRVKIPSEVRHTHGAH